MLSTSLFDTIVSDGGFTYDVSGDSLVRIGSTSGYAIAIPGTEILLGDVNLTREEFAQRFTALMRKAATSKGIYVGGWLSPDRGYMIELSEVHHIDRSSAIALGVDRGQESILDLSTGVGPIDNKATDEELMDLGRQLYDQINEQYEHKKVENTMWQVTRSSINAKSDEDSSMAFVDFARVNNKDVAHMLLISSVRRELRLLVDESNPHYFNVYCINRLANILSQVLHPGVMIGEYEGLRFQARERSGIWK